MATALLAGHGPAERYLAGELRLPEPLASQAGPPRHAWDSQATGGEGPPGVEAWARNPGALHPVPTGKCPPVGDCVLDFPYRDEVLLLDHQGNAGRVWIPEEARERGGAFPLLVLLHGVELSDDPEPPHKLLSPPMDLSTVVRRHLGDGRLPPLLVAAPSQTRDAGGSSTLWTAEGFDLSSFLETLDKELADTTQVRICREEVSVFGHSGAGCVLTSHRRSGVLRVADQLDELRKEGIGVRLLGLMDTCFFGGGGGAFLAARLDKTDTQLFAMWVEPEQWSGLDRDLDGFAQALGATLKVPCSSERYEECLATPGGARLYRARSERLTQAFGPTSEADPDGLTPHSALTFWFMDEALSLYLGAQAPRSPASPSSPPSPRASPSAPVAPTSTASHSHPLPPQQ